MKGVCFFGVKAIREVFEVNKPAGRYGRFYALHSRYPRGNAPTSDDIAEIGAPALTTGISYVLVNGTIVVKDSEVLPNAFPGQPIRFEPATES